MPLMPRADALAMIEKQVTNRNLKKHMLATEAVMRALAARLGQDVELWGLAGLVHDCDYDQTAKDPARHAVVGGEMLAQVGCPPELVHAVMAHAEKAPRESLFDKALWCVDPTTGFLVSCALIRPEKKLAIVDVPFIKNRMAEKGFSRAVDRDQIKSCESFGVPLDEFLQLALDAMKAISGEIGL